MTNGLADEPEFWNALKEVEHAALFYGRLPPCFSLTALACYDCPFESAIHCPIRGDPDYRSYLGYLRLQHAAYERRRQERVEVLTSVLERHGLRMHWEYLAILAMEEAPTGLFPSIFSVKSVLERNPDTFYMEMEGVFNLVRRRSQRND